ncbi:hypothetical protein WJX72_009582 [[Myrmecia] bisecta]|uniref:EamA domain-containing protein n=1 Tax=[Myrmecia] bisecta TaxID=41462 RepID=A0AAW1R7U7_9CHLO
MVAKARASFEISRGAVHTYDGVAPVALQQPCGSVDYGLLLELKPSNSSKHQIAEHSLYSTLASPHQHPRTDSIAASSQGQSVVACSVGLLDDSHASDHEDDSDTEAPALASSHHPPHHHQSALAPRTRRTLLIGGLELGVWGFIANVAMVMGFEFTNATRGAFLLRLSSLFTPIIAVCFGETVSAMVWLGSVMAGAGGFLISLDQSGVKEAHDASNSIISGGDALIAGAALIWSLQTVRYGRYAPHCASVPLSAIVFTATALLSVLWVAADLVLITSRGQPASTIWPGYRDPVSWFVMLWAAVFPWAVGTILQVKGQRKVPASQAQIIQSSDALFSTAFAGLLGAAEQHLGGRGWAGAAVIIGATLIGSRGSIHVE